MEFAGGYSDYVVARLLARSQQYAAHEKYASERGRLTQRLATQRSWSEQGVRTVLQNLLTDLKVVGDINAACERAAAEIGVRPEEVEIDMGTRRFRYLKIFTIRPDAPLAGTALDFSGETIGPDLLHGYRDACAQIENFLAYAQRAKFKRPRHVLRFSPEHDPSRTA